MTAEMAAPGIVNAMTIDIEDYFHAQALSTRVKADQWDSLSHRVEGNTERALKLFSEADVRATFFVLGWVAERYPALIRRIVGMGHELASHGWNHTRVDMQDAEMFRADVRRTKSYLEDVGGVAVRGYRAATFSIGAGNLWAFDVLQEEGYSYSSSIYPVRRDYCGMPTAPRFTFHPSGPNGIAEHPMTTVQVAGRTFPCSGGGYFRLLPYPLSRWALQRVNRADRQPCVFYFHPWEIDAGQPRISGLPLRSRFRHYTNLRGMEGRIRQLLKDFSWDRMDRLAFESQP
jgi:polysaccharide deacetylase family protein (PEP-CTERM system associated)